MSGMLWIILVAFVAGIVMRMLLPGPNNPTGCTLCKVRARATSARSRRQTWV